MMSGADTQAYRKAFARLELAVVVDVAMTETARAAHFVLPAASQFEKWEATGFNLEFPENSFHLRAPIFEPLGDSRPEPEIYGELLTRMGELPARHPILERIARLDRAAPRLGLFMGAMAAAAVLQPRLRDHGAHVLYRTLGRTLPDHAAAAAPIWFLAHGYARKHREAVTRAGHRAGFGLTLGESLFASILGSRAGTIISRHLYEDCWRFIRHPDRKIHLEIPQMIEALDALRDEPPPAADFPFVLIAGERRAYNANTIYRDPAWRKNDAAGALRIHPADADHLGLQTGDRAICRSARGQVEVTIERHDAIRPGVVTLPHGYGLRYAEGETHGPAINQLTDSAHRDPIAGTPFHKYVPVRIERPPVG